LRSIRRHLQPTSLWLAALLFVGQIFAVAHATQHELAAQGSQPACEICVVANGAGALPIAPQSLDLPQGHDQLLVVARPVRVARLAVERPRSRAPPVLI